MPPDQEQSSQQSLMQERAYIAHELHDSLAQTLASVRYHIRNLDHAIQGGDECEIYELLEVVEDNVEIANTELRELIRRFRAPMSGDSLIPAIEGIIRKFKDETGLNTVLQNRLGEIEFPPTVMFQVVRIVQEAMANTRKHAKADMVRVMMHFESDLYHVLVEDDGIGFDQELWSGAEDRHFGLNVMCERAARINGELGIDSVPDEGTRVLLTFPKQEVNL